MKTKRALAAIFTVAAITAGMVACGKTKNNTENASTPPASQCTRRWDGVMVDQYGRQCANYPTNNCANAVYNPQTGQYTDRTTGAPLQCQGSYYDGYNSIPYYGQYQGQQIYGCQGWSQIYGAYYVPVDLGNGQMICMNTAYLQQQNPYYQYNWYNAYYYQTPIYTCQSYDCYGGYYYGRQYGCSTNFNIGFDWGYGYGNFGMCL